MAGSDGCDDRGATQPAESGEATLTRDPLSTGAERAGIADHAVLGAGQIRDPGRYEILGEHGRGGLGRVSRAHDRELGRDVAIKELISSGHGGEARFVREALITARLEHPGIVPVHEAGRWPDGTPFYAMKLVSGRPLRELIAERTTLDGRLGLLHHVIAVADALAYAHGRNIIHRDLKPSNVIVGEFGETVVIDWGIAKDLSAADEPGPADDGTSPYRIAATSDLTATGSILGTPAYMAPEQERGEAVDQRADVFAIGAMLWELCAQPRSPQGGSGGSGGPAGVGRAERRRVLREAGLDRDLATIIGKALDPDRERRYPDAGALAEDLKAFKAGARIAARRYTLPAVAAHWIRRHRALALAIAAVVVAAAGGAIMYVRNIAAERDRVAAANNQLVLEHTELLLHTDPTLAVAALADYHGSDEVRRRRLLAEAEGRGVARAVFAPHNDAVWFAVGEPTGAIISLGEDRRIQLTQGAISTTLATDVATHVRIAYAPARRLLAYATVPAGIAVLDLAARTTRKLAALDPEAMQLSPDGARLAALDASGQLAVWPTTGDPAPIHRASLPGAARLAFATPSRLIVQDRAGLSAIALDDAGRAGRADGAAATVAIAGITALDARSDVVVAGTDAGNVMVLSAGLEVQSTKTLCHKEVRYARLIPRAASSTGSRGDLLAFSCRDGVTGVARLAGNAELAIVDMLPTRGTTDVFEPDPSGRYLLVTDESSTAYVYDTTARLTTRYEGGIAALPSSISAPTPGFDHVLLGDFNGTVRVWDPPAVSARVVLAAGTPVFGLSFAPDSKTLFTDGAGAVVRAVRLGGGGDGAVTDLPAGAFVRSVRVAPDGRSIAALGTDGAIRTWRTGAPAGTEPVRRFTEHGSAVEDADFIERGRRVVSVGDDGRLLAWTPDGSDVAVLFRNVRPLTAVETLARTDHVVIDDSEGAVWDVAAGGAVRQVRRGDGTALNTLRASRDGSYLVIGSETGTVTVYETQGWTVVRTLKMGGGIRQLTFDPQNRDLLVASESDRAQSGHVAIVALDGRRALPWRDLPMAVRDAAYSPDGEVLGFACADGGTWLYSVRGDTWVYVRDHGTDTLTGTFSPDGKWFASTDLGGLVIVRDVASTFAAAVHSPPTGMR